MSARDVIARHLCGRDGQGWSGISTFERAAYRTQAHGIVGVITTAGYVILSPDEVRGIRDEALEEAARHARECFDDPQADADPDYVPAAVRSLKGGRDAQ